MPLSVMIKAILAAIESQKQLLLTETTDLKRDIKNLDMADPRSIAILQVALQSWKGIEAFGRAYI